MKKLVSILLALALALGLNAAFAESSSPFAGGAGTEEDPWQIATADQLLALSAAVNDGSANGYYGAFFVLTDDIDLTGVAWQPIGHLDLNDQSNMSVMFMGTFDGQGHTISNISFSTDGPVCGAGIIGMNLGEVKNLNAKNISVLCTNDFSMAIGCVVGFNMGGSIHDVTLTGENSVSGVNCIGGIAGGNSAGTVVNCVVEGTTVRVLGDNDFSSGRIIQVDMAECGGLVIGGSLGGTIDSCKASGKVVADGNEPVGMGGIAGCLQMMDTVTNCTADAEIVSARGGHAVGGLCGYAGTHSDGNIIAEKEGVVTTKYPGIIDNCHVTVTMNVPGATHVGGLVGTGLYFFGEESAYQISNCSVKGSITGAVTPGAVAGRAVNSMIESCDTDITLDGEALTAQVGETSVPYESEDQTEDATEDAA